MVDSMDFNGEVENQMMENFYDANEAQLIDLSIKIEALESENFELNNENKEVKEKIKKLTLEINELQNKEEEMNMEMDQWENDNRALELVTVKSTNLETEVSKLQHDLITSMSEIDEANKEVAELKCGLEEKRLVIERLDKEIDELKKEKVESEKKKRELERKLGILEVKETEERSKKVRIEEEMREKIDEFNKKVKDLKVYVARTRAELEQTKEQKRESDESAIVFDLNVLKLKKALEERTSEAINGQSKEIFGSIDCEEKGLEGLNLPIVAAGTTGVVVVMAVVVYLCFKKRS